MKLFCSKEARAAIINELASMTSHPSRQGDGAQGQGGSPVSQILLWPRVLHACCGCTHHAHVARLLRGSSHGVPCPPWVVALAKAWRGWAHHATTRARWGPSHAGCCPTLHQGLRRWPATPISPTIVLAHAPWGTGRVADVGRNNQESSSQGQETRQAGAIEEGERENEAQG